MTTRRELTFAACDALATEGIKPAMASVRKWTYENAGGKRGSDPDVQGDINAWYESLLKLKRDAIAVPGLPDHVATKALDFWLAAQDAALDQLSSERQAVAQQREEVDQQLAVKNQEIEQMRQAMTALQHDLDISREALHGRDDTIKRLEDGMGQLQAVGAAKDERLEGLTAELSRKSSDHASALVELDGLRRHSLLQIDNARSEARHWKTEYDRLDADMRGQVEQYRQRAARLDTELATARGRLEAVEAELSRRIASEAAGLLAAVQTHNAAAPGLRGRIKSPRKQRVTAVKRR